MSERLAVAVPLSRETAFSDGKQIPVFLLPEGAAPRVLIDYTGAARGVTVATSVWTGPVTGAFLDAAKASALIQAGGSGDVRHVLTMADGVVFVTRFRVAREDMYHV
jgi:hypothetical protein